MRCRFAPSPTGPLHLGHAYSAWLNHDLACAHGGDFLLRIEDIDATRARPEWERGIVDDLHWLGLEWDEPPMRQSERLSRYREALEVLWKNGVLFPCHCSRSDIAAAASAPQEGFPTIGPDGIVYPGTCRARDRTGRMPEGVLRLDIRAAMRQLGQDVDFIELAPASAGTHRYSADHLITKVGDVVLARHGMGTSYHLSVVVDDADQDITHVVRGTDLQEATVIHVVLQKLLGLPTPAYLHHALVRDATGRRLAKRHDARAIREYRARGATAADLRRMLGLGQAVSTSTSSPSRMPM